MMCLGVSSSAHGMPHASPQIDSSPRFDQTHILFPGRLSRLGGHQQSLET